MLVKEVMMKEESTTINIHDGPWSTGGRKYSTFSISM
jgi:hypothetical protein